MKYSELMPLSNSAKYLPEPNGKYPLPAQSYKFFKRVELKEK